MSALKENQIIFITKMKINELSLDLVHHLLHTIKQIYKQVYTSKKADLANELGIENSECHLVMKDKNEKLAMLNKKCLRDGGTMTMAFQTKMGHILVL